MFFLRSQTGHRRLTVAVAGVALAALLAACGSSGGSSSAGPASDTSSPAGTTNTAADTATDTAAATGTGAGTDSAPGAGGGATDAELASATALVAQWTAPLTAASYPTPTTLTKKVDIKGKTVYLVPLTDQGVIHSIVVGVEQALTAAGAKYKVCDGGAGGQPNPTNWGNCLKAAGDANADIVMSLLIDYNAVSTQFNALIKKGIPVLIAGVQDVGLTAVPGKAAIYDNTARLKDAYGKLAVSALAHGGKDTNTLWLRLLDSTATTNASDAGIAKSKEICAGCDVQSADFTTANSQAQLAATVSAALVKHPDLNAVVVPADTFTPLVIQGIQQAGKAGKVQIVSGSGSLDAMQRIKDGKQAATQGGPTMYEGWVWVNGLMQMLAGMTVEKTATAASREFNSDNIGSISLTTAASADDSWFGQGQPYINGFLKAWGLS